MTELLTAEQMRRVEKAAIASRDVTGLELMERAGAGVVEAVLERWPELSEGGHHAVVLCGPGNNGGDGFVVARLLKERGWEVEVLFHGNADRLSDDAKANHDRWSELGDISPLTAQHAGQGLRPVLLVDAMFGTGLSRAIPLELAEAFHAVETRATDGGHPWLVPYHRVAVDCPSGLDCDSGKFLLPDLPQDSGKEEADVAAWSDWWQNDASRRLLSVDLTVTFHRAKIAHALHDGGAPVRVVDIDLGPEDRHPAHLLFPRPVDRVIALDFDKPVGRSRAVWPGSLIRKGNGEGGHKYTHGHALVLSGGPGSTGAARLAARGALRIGAGLVSLGVPPAAQQEVASQVTAVMLLRIADADALAEALCDDRIVALCLGPGLGMDRARDLVAAALDARRATVLDADALSAFGDAPEALFDKLHDACVLTPHGGEFSRLFPDLAEKMNAHATKGPAFSKVDATRAAARRAGCVVVHKGVATVIAAPNGACSINAAKGDRAAPWLATAGAGDVLSGFITGLLARGIDPQQAAEVAVWLHVECGRAYGPGLIAEDLPEVLPGVMGALIA